MTRSSPSTYLMAARSSRSSFSIGIEAKDEPGAIDEAVRLANKARLPKDATVLLIHEDGTESDISTAVTSRLQD